MISVIARLRYFLLFCIIATLFSCNTSDASEVLLKVGDALPRIQYRTLENKVFDLNAFVKRQPTVLIYYRGGWCPYCNKHHKDLRKIEDEIKKRGYTLLAVSPDSVITLNETKAYHSENYRLLSDSSMKGAQALGIAFKLDDKTVTKYKGYGIDLEASSGHSHHLLPKPTVLVIGQDSKLRFIHVSDDYKVRLSNKELLKAL